MSLSHPPILEASHSSQDGDRRWELVQRVAASNEFRRSGRLRDFLLYISECSLSDRLDEITQPQIGIHVFGRKAGYNYSEDNIVRSQARVLRLKLNCYFSNEGKNEPVVIQIPKGSYVPMFLPRQERATTPRIEPPQEVPQPRTSPLVYALSSAAVVLLFLCAWLLTGREAPAVALARSAARANPLWERIFDPDRRTLIVVSDHAFAMNQEALGRSLTLTEYLSPSYRSGQMTDPRLEGMIRSFASRHYTLLSDVTAVAQIMRLREVTPEQVSIRYARDLAAREILAGNTVLLGGTDVNPWRELYEPQLNFVQTWDYKAQKNVFLNRHPRPGEKERYDTRYGSQQYGGVAFVPNLNQTGDVLLVFGTAMAAVEATMDFLGNPAQCSSFFEKLKAEAGSSDLPYFELLLNSATVTTTSTEVPTRASIVAHRLILGP